MLQFLRPTIKIVLGFVFSRLALRSIGYMHNNTETVTTDQSSGKELAIKVRGVTKRFGSTVAVDQVDFDVNKGEVIGFLGPNGSGKSTTMRLLTSYYTPDEGTIEIEGIDNQKYDIDTRRLIGYLPENNPLYSDLLVNEYLDFVADLRGMTRHQKGENLDQVVQETGISEVFFKPINTLSKGYRQRVGMAQAILHLPDILIMDEPTEGLDPNQRLTIRDLIRSLGSERTVMLSTHVLQEVEATCDRLLVIHRGRIVAEGTPDELRGGEGSGRVVEIELEGDGVEGTLDGLTGVDSIEKTESINARQKFTIRVSGIADIRPEIFRMAKEKDWTLWELHEDRVELQDLFISLTSGTDLSEVSDQKLVDKS